MSAVAHPVRDHCLAPDRAVDSPIAPVGGRYGRAFPELPALESDQAALLALGSSGGLCDGSDATGDDGTAAAGWPFFGQFIAHDITADRSPIGPHADATTIANFRSPRANLECLYGAGPVGAPYLYDARDPAKLLAGDGDVPRNEQGTALLGDPRNDVHVFISQLHHALIGAHNRLVDRLREDGVDPAECFDAARRAAMWHYQWVIVEDFLVELVGRDLVEEVKDPERRHFRPEGTPIIPFEFADAAFRYGHGQIRHRYRLQDGRRRVRRLPRPRRLSPRGTRAPDRLAPALRPRGAAGQAHGRAAGRLAHRPARSPSRATSRSRPTTRSRRATCSAAPPSACPRARRWRARSGSRRSRATRPGWGRSGGRARRRCGSTCCARPTCAAAASASARSAGASWRRCCSACSTPTPSPTACWLPTGSRRSRRRASASARSTCWSAPP